MPKLNVKKFTGVYDTKTGEPLFVDDYIEMSDEELKTYKELSELTKKTKWEDVVPSGFLNKDLPYSRKEYYEWRGSLYKQKQYSKSVLFGNHQNDNRELPNDAYSFDSSKEKLEKWEKENNIDNPAIKINWDVIQ